MKHFIKAFEILLDTCLSITEEDTISIVFDEEVEKYMDSLIEACSKKNITPTFFFLPLKTQRTLVALHHQNNEEADVVQQNILLPQAMSIALSESTVIINMLNSLPETTLIRTAVVEARSMNQCKLAHIPGLSDEVLELINQSSFDEISKSAESIAWVLGQSHEGLLVTMDNNGNKYELYFDLEGWNNEPLLSTSIIGKGSWGNIPPGEAFCCPIPSKVTGKVVINGSLPNFIFTNEQEVVLTFVKGRLTEYLSKDESVREYFDSLKQKAALKHDPNWNVFAELGIGLNSKIKKLTGNPLFDEKMLSTVHVAIGNNTLFGHNNFSRIHIDMTIINPTLILGETEVMTRGTINFQEIKKWHQFVANSTAIPEMEFVTVEYDKIDIDSDYIYRKLIKGGRRYNIPILRICDHPWAQSLRGLLQNQSPTTLRLNDLYALCHDDKTEVNRLLSNFLNYKVIHT